MAWSTSKIRNALTWFQDMHRYNQHSLVFLNIMSLTTIRPFCTISVVKAPISTKTALCSIYKPSTRSRHAKEAREVFS